MGFDDPLSTLPESVLLHICSMLDLQSIANLSNVNKQLHKFCDSNELWERIYYQHNGAPSPETYVLAEEKTWKVVFFMSKLHLQKELSRRRKQLSPPSSQSSVNEDQGKSPLV